jgi:type I restriction enzyme M protein
MHAEAPRRQTYVRRGSLEDALVELEPTSSSPEKQGFSAGRGTDSGTVTDAGEAGDSKDDRWRCFSIRVVKDREFKLASFKWLKEESVEDADDLPEPEELATDAIAELEGAVEELTAVLTLLENGGKL